MQDASMTGDAGGDATVTTSTWCADSDMDGFGDATACTEVADGVAPPSGSVGFSVSNDCDDADDDTFPGAAQLDDEDACMTDADGDGFGDTTPSANGVTAGTDCDDASGATFPGAAQIEGPDSCMLDEDDDGYGADLPPAGVVAGSDCDDADDAVLTCERWCDDGDGDGQGDASECVGVAPGGQPPASYVQDDRDCADDDEDVFVGAAAEESALCTKDDDDDGFGDAVIASTVPTAENGTDCLDSDEDTFPGAAETDDAARCMRDADGDGWGDRLAPVGVEVGRDCDDDDGARVVCVTATPSCVSTALGVGTQLQATAVGGDGSYTWLWDNAATLDDATLQAPIASPTAITTYTVTVTDGAGNTGSNPTTVHLEDVSWVLGGAAAECVAVGFLGAAAPHSFANMDTTTCTTGNSDPTAYVCPRVHENARIAGTIVVNPPVDDDDFVGFVWGYQNADQFYMLHWKQAAQNIGGCTSAAGITVKRFDRVQAYAAGDFTCNTSTANATVLLTPAQTTTAGWAHGVTYGIEIEYGNTETQITITNLGNNAVVADFIVEDATYPRGQFGTYDYSQIRACNGPWTSGCL